MCGVVSRPGRGCLCAFARAVLDGYCSRTTTAGRGEAAASRRGEAAREGPPGNPHRMGREAGESAPQVPQRLASVGDPSRPPELGAGTDLRGDPRLAQVAAVR